MGEKELRLLELGPLELLELGPLELLELLELLPLELGALILLSLKTLSSELLLLVLVRLPTFMYALGMYPLILVKMVSSLSRKWLYVGNLSEGIVGESL